MAKNQTNTEEVEVDEVEETEETEASIITPKMLSEELGVDAKRIRAYLRANHARALEAKNTSWNIPADTAEATREYFLMLQAKKDQVEDEEEDDDTDSDES